jgi:hypothetical protein
VRALLYILAGPKKPSKYPLILELAFPNLRVPSEGVLIYRELALLTSFTPFRNVLQPALAILTKVT